MDIYLTGGMKKDVYCLSRKASLNDCERAEFCNPLHEHYSDDRKLFWCELGTMGCTEGHGGSWQIISSEQLQKVVKKYHRFPRRLRFWIGRLRLKKRINAV